MSAIVLREQSTNSNSVAGVWLELLSRSSRKLRVHCGRLLPKPIILIRAGTKDAREVEIEKEDAHAGRWK